MGIWIPHRFSNPTSLLKKSQGSQDFLYLETLISQRIPFFTTKQFDYGWKSTPFFVWVAGFTDLISFSSTGCFCWPFSVETQLLPPPPGKVRWLAGTSTMNEDVFPIENGDVPASHLSFQGCNLPRSPDTHRVTSHGKNLQVLSAAVKCTGASLGWKSWLHFWSSLLRCKNHWMQIGSHDSLRVVCFFPKSAFRFFGLSLLKGLTCLHFVLLALEKFWDPKMVLTRLFQQSF